MKTNFATIHRRLDRRRARLLLTGLKNLDGNRMKKISGYIRHVYANHEFKEIFFFWESW